MRGVSDNLFTFRFVSSPPLIVPDSGKSSTPDFGRSVQRGVCLQAASTRGRCRPLPRCVLMRLPRGGDPLPSVRAAPRRQASMCFECRSFNRAVKLLSSGSFIGAASSCLTRLLRLLHGALLLTHVLRGEQGEEGVVVEVPVPWHHRMVRRHRRRDCAASTSWSRAPRPSSLVSVPVAKRTLSAERRASS